MKYLAIFVSLFPFFVCSQENTEKQILDWINLKFSDSYKEAKNHNCLNKWDCVIKEYDENKIVIYKRNLTDQVDLTQLILIDLSQIESLHIFNGEIVFDGGIEKWVEDFKNTISIDKLDSKSYIIKKLDALNSYTPLLIDPNLVLSIPINGKYCYNSSNSFEDMEKRYINAFTDLLKLNNSSIIINKNIVDPNLY
jgi:hypothetical protein